MTLARLVVVLALLLPACGSSPPTHYYTLTATPAAGQAIGAAGKPVLIGHVALPGDLDRDSLVTRIGPNRLNVSDQDRWAGPLDQMIQSVLATDLASRLPSGMVLAPGDPVPQRGVRSVAVNIRQFMGDAAGHVVLDADWSLLAGNPAAAVLRRHETLTADAGSPGAAEIVAAMSRLLGELSGRIADGVSGARHAAIGRDARMAGGCMTAPGQHATLRPEAPMAEHMTREKFRRWAEEQGDGRFERVAGEIVPMTPERVIHVQLKLQVWRALADAVRRSGVACQALGDGLAVEIDEDTDYEPDALVNSGEPLPPDAIAATNPLIVVEVLSPATKSIDTGAKLADYFRVPAVRHYLIVHARRRQIIHHRRAEQLIETRLVSAGLVHLDPPGIAIDLADVYDGTGV